MREIKFRAWDKKNKKMCKVLTIAFAELSGMNIEIQGLVGYYFLDNPRHTETYFELMQYTGLKDENGKEIYEGDIVKNSDNWGLTKGIIEWDDEYFGYPLLSEEVATGNKLIVIGNIYEGEG